MPIADPRAFELGSFTEEQAEKLQEQLADAAERAAGKATDEYRERLRAALNHTAHQLRNGKRLHGSLLSNLRLLLKADLNVADHPELAEILENAESLEPAVEQALTDPSDQETRDKAANSAETIDRRLAGLRGDL